MEELLNDKIKDFITSQKGLKCDIEKFNKSNGQFPEDALENSIKRARVDMMARTLKVKDKKEVKNFKECVYSVLSEEMKKYFNDQNDYYKEESNFDTWHYKTCIVVLDVLKKYYCTRNYKDKNDTSKPVNYGKAQKIVNMTFKYLYCFADVETRKKYFKYCHMPIDSYILKWLEEDKNLKILNEMDEFKDLKLEKSKFSCWSNLQYCEDNKYYTYDTVCEMIRKLVEKNCGGKFTPLEAEFFIWKQMKEQA